MELPQTAQCQADTVNTSDEFVVSKLQEVLDDVSTAAPKVSDGDERSSTESLSAPLFSKGWRLQMELIKLAGLRWCSPMRPTSLVRAVLRLGPAAGRPTRPTTQNQLFPSYSNPVNQLQYDLGVSREPEEQTVLWRRWGVERFARNIKYEIEFLLERQRFFFIVFQLFWIRKVCMQRRAAFMEIYVNIIIHFVTGRKIYFVCRREFLNNSNKYVVWLLQLWMWL